MLFTINLVWIFLGVILMMTGMHQVVKPYTFVYTVWCMFCFVTDSDYCAMSVSLHVQVNCVYDVMWAWLSVSAISLIITFAVLWDYFSQGMSRLMRHQLSFSIYYLTHFSSWYTCESTFWDNTHTHSKGVSVTLQLHILLQLYAYIIIQLHIIHQRPRIMIVYHMISEVIQNNLICIIRFHGVDIPIVFQWGYQ